jgi:hypothetical protein
LTPRAGEPLAGRQPTALVAAVASAADLVDVIADLERQVPALAQIAPSERAIIVGTEAGSLRDLRSFQSEIRRVGAHLVNPGLFPLTVMNAAAGLAAIRCRCEGPNLTLTNAAPSVLDALSLASEVVASRRAAVVFAGGFEASTGDGAPLAVLAAVIGNDVPAAPRARFELLATGCARGGGQADAAALLDAAVAAASDAWPPAYRAPVYAACVTTARDTLVALWAAQAAITAAPDLLLAPVICRGVHTRQSSFVVLARHAGA